MPRVMWHGHCPEQRSLDDTSTWQYAAEETRKGSAATGEGLTHADEPNLTPAELPSVLCIKRSSSSHCWMASYNS